MSIPSSQSLPKKITLRPCGRVQDVVGTVVESLFPSAKLGELMEVHLKEEKVLAEVVGFRQEMALLLPFSNIKGVHAGARITSVGSSQRIPCGPHLLGRILDPFLNPLDEKPFFRQNSQTLWMNLDQDPPNPLTRQRIQHPLSLGVRSIDSLSTFCEGQRMGIMAGSGVGKSVLLGMIAKSALVDVTVIGLIGERGREVREFIERDLTETGLQKAVVVVCTGDQSPLMRVRAAKAVTTIAESFARSGKKVLIMLDSLTRVAQAQREIGLSIGEPATTKGYTPSVFSLLPKILERCGPLPVGSISGLYTVLVDGDNFQDPLTDAIRAILDGHLTLTRELALKGHFPAIDIPLSLSRVMSDVVSAEHWSMAQKLRSFLGIYKENLDYIQIGSYQKGSFPLLDQAIDLMPHIETFLRQDLRETASMKEALSGLKKILTLN